MLYLTPHALSIGPQTSNCGPCDPSGIPGFDRWALVAPQAGWGQASTGALVGLAGAVGAELASTPGGARHAVAMIDAGALAVGLTELLKGITGRRRPILYTSEAPGAVAVTNNRRSLPSGHTSAAFAIATSYWLSRRMLHDGRPGLPAWMAMVAATGVGVMRVAAGKHFPSDVVAGAAVGVGTAILVHVVKF